MSTEIAEYIVASLMIAMLGGFPLWLYTKYMRDQKKRHEEHSKIIHKHMGS